MNRHRLRYAGLAAAIIVAILVVLVSLGLYPVMMVGSSFITKQQRGQYVETAKKLDPNASEQDIVNQMVRNKSLEQLAFERNIKPDFERELAYQIFGREDDYWMLLDEYFASDPGMYKEMVTRPAAIDALLRIEYNINEAKERSEAENVLRQIENGKAFEEAAKIESDDKLTGQIGGDLGFVRKTQVAPEIMDAVEEAAVGEIKKEIVTSRFGYHILYLVETSRIDGEQVWHLKHILTEATGYESWLNRELGRIKIWHLF